MIGAVGGTLGVIGGALVGTTAPAPTPTLDSIGGPARFERIEATRDAGLATTYISLDSTPLGARTIYVVVTVAADATGSQSVVDGSPERSKIGFDNDAWVAYGGSQPPAMLGSQGADKGKKFVIAATFNPDATSGNRTILYRDGVQIAASTAAVATVTSQVRFGERYGGGEVWTGGKHYLRVHDGIHDAATVAAMSDLLYEQHVATPPTTTLFVDESQYPAGYESWQTYVWLPPNSPSSYGDLGTKGLDVTNLDDNQDYRIVLPEAFEAHVKRLGLNGGRNRWVVGMDGLFTGPNGNYAFTPGYDNGYNQLADFGVDKNQFLHINGSATANSTPKVCIIEGFAARGQYFLEGITYDGKQDNGDTSLILQNGYMELISWVDNSSAGGTHLGGDPVQTWGPLRNLIVSGFTVAEFTYQFAMLQHSGAELLELKRIDATGSRTWGHGTPLFDNTDNAGRATVIGAKGTIEGVYLDLNPADASKENQIAQEVKDQITYGPSPFGPNVRPDQVGVYYHRL